jgi:hypothetical protein
MTKDLLRCPHKETELVEHVYPEPVGIEWIEVCKRCGKEI